MDYSNVNKEFSKFNIYYANIEQLRKEVEKMTELKEYYEKKHLGAAVNSKYFYDLWEFFLEKKIELELALEKYEKEERIRNYEES